MSDSVNVFRRATALDTAPSFSPFTGVKLWCDDENYVFAGDSTGRVLEADLPWATETIAESVLASITGFVYQPFTAESALLDPAAEIGDGVTVGGVYSVLASIDTKFDALCASDIAAPADEEIDHEYHYTSQEKKLARRVSKMTSELRVMSDSITAIVEDVEENSTKIEQTAESITAEVTARTDADTALESKITLNTESITAEVTARENADTELASKITVEADRITAEVTARENADTALGSRITQTATELTAKVESAEGNASTALQTANMFSTRITDAEGNISSIEQTLDGVVYMSNNGTTVIDGSYIKTGTLEANKLIVAGQSLGGTSSCLDAIYAVYGSITSLSSHGLTLNFNSPDEGVPVEITGAGVKVGSNALVSWSDIIAGGTGAAVFG